VFLRAPFRTHFNVGVFRKTHSKRHYMHPKKLFQKSYFGKVYSKIYLIHSENSVTRILFPNFYSRIQWILEVVSQQVKWHFENLRECAKKLWGAGSKI